MSIFPLIFAITFSVLIISNHGFHARHLANKATQSLLSKRNVNSFFKRPEKVVDESIFDDEPMWSAAKTVKKSTRAIDSRLGVEDEFRWDSEHFKSFVFFLSRESPRIIEINQNAHRPREKIRYFR